MTDRKSYPNRCLHSIVTAVTGRQVRGSNGATTVIKNNQKARQNPNTLAQLDGYKRGLVNSLTGNLHRFGFDRASKAETLQDIIEEMGEAEAEDAGAPGT